MFFFFFFFRPLEIMFSGFDLSKSVIGSVIGEALLNASSDLESGLSNALGIDPSKAVAEGAQNGAGSLVQNEKKIECCDDPCVQALCRMLLPNIRLAFSPLSHMGASTRMRLMRVRAASQVTPPAAASTEPTKTVVRKVVRKAAPPAAGETTVQPESSSTAHASSGGVEAAQSPQGPKKLVRVVKKVKQAAAGAGAEDVGPEAAQTRAPLVTERAAQPSTIADEPEPSPVKLPSTSSSTAIPSAAEEHEV